MADGLFGILSIRVNLHALSPLATEECRAALGPIMRHRQIQAAEKPFTGGFLELALRPGDELLRASDGIVPLQKFYRTGNRAFDGQADRWRAPVPLQTARGIISGAGFGPV